MLSFVRTKVFYPNRVTTILNLYPSCNCTKYSSVVNIKVSQCVFQEDSISIESFQLMYPNTRPKESARAECYSNTNVAEKTTRSLDLPSTPSKSLVGAPCFVMLKSFMLVHSVLYCGAVKAWWGSSPYTGPIKIFFISLRIERIPGEGWNRITISQIGATRYTKGNMHADILR